MYGLHFASLHNVYIITIQRRQKSSYNKQKCPFKSFAFFIGVCKCNLEFIFISCKSDILNFLPIKKVNKEGKVDGVECKLSQQIKIDVFIFQLIKTTKNCNGNANFQFVVYLAGAYAAQTVTIAMELCT